MFIDLNVPIPAPTSTPQTQSQSSKKKGKQVAAQTTQPNVAFSSTQIVKLEARIDLLVRLGYTVLAFNQTVESKVDTKAHVDVLDPLLKQLRKRQGILFLKRLTITLDEDSEKNNGLTAGNIPLLSPYDILAVHPTTQTSFSNACLTYTVPSALTTHIISIPLTSPRLPFRLKHTLIRTAIKNGAVFEINYAGTLQGDDERRNWWAAARELARVTKGKGLIVSGGTEVDASLRAPRDVGNIISLLGLAQNIAHDASTTSPKSLILRAQTRKTYRAILSEPSLIMPANELAANKSVSVASAAPLTASTTPEQSRTEEYLATPSREIRPELQIQRSTPQDDVTSDKPVVPSEDSNAMPSAIPGSTKKRARNVLELEEKVGEAAAPSPKADDAPDGRSKKKKRKDKGKDA